MWKPTGGPGWLPRGDCYIPSATLWCERFLESGLERAFWSTEERKERVVGQAQSGVFAAQHLPRLWAESAASSLWL